jgi:hypothetical protein
MHARRHKQFAPLALATLALAGCYSEDVIKAAYQVRLLEEMSGSGAGNPVVVFAVLPGDSRNPGSDLNKAQSGASVNEFDPDTSMVMERGSTLLSEVPAVRGVQGGAVMLDDEGMAIPETLVGTRAPGISISGTLRGGGTPVNPTPLIFIPGAPEPLP